mmetsp:Transcript_43530/g.102268  ORF Transcript_43530/g.102268 Transcript_43530/m.102268 type:complete len:680 (-) Transcript_43530:72-2111(-)
MATVESLFEQLQTILDEDNHEEALPVINSILAKDEDDADAIQCKMVCLIQLKRFEEALATIRSKPAAANQCAFEKAYVLYRLNRHADSLDVINEVHKPGSTDDEDVRIELLRAQVLYRLGRYKESGEAYADFKDEDTDPAELKVNHSAALCAAGEADDAEEVLATAVEELGDTADLAYNRACAIIAKGDMDGALKALDEAEQLFLQESEEHAFSEEDIQDGRIVFIVQRGFVRQRLGQTDAAQEAYEEALKLKPSEGEVAAVASNNLFALRGKETSLFDSAKKAKALNLDEQVEDKLTLHQRRVFALNRCLLSLYMNKTKECHTALVKLEKELEGSEVPTLIRAALLAREKKMEECTALLQEHAQANPRTATLVKLTLAQIQLTQGDKQGAVKALQSVDGAYGMLGVVGSMVKLFESLREVEGALGVLARASKEAEGKAATRKLLLLSADLRVANGDAAGAMADLEKLVKDGEKDPAVLARLVQVCVDLDLAKAEQYAAKLPEVEANGELDVQELETFVRAAPTRDNQTDQILDVSAAKAQAAALAEKKREKRRLRRKKEKAQVVKEDGTSITVEAFRLPKKYEELVNIGSWGKPDPERWLPWHQRSYNRKLLKKRKGAGTASGGSQGGAGAAGAAAVLDRSEKFQAQLASSKEEEEAPAAAAASTSSSSKKNKKKGRK